MEEIKVLRASKDSQGLENQPSLKNQIEEPNQEDTMYDMIIGEVLNDLCNVQEVVAIEKGKGDRKGVRISRSNCNDPGRHIPNKSHKFLFNQNTYESNFLL